MIDVQQSLSYLAQLQTNVLLILLIKKKAPAIVKFHQFAKEKSMECKWKA